MSEAKTEIEYEEITVKVPKQIMDLLRYSEKMTEKTPKEYVEYCIVECVRADLDSDVFLSGHALAKSFNVQPIFKEITGTSVY